MPNGKNPAVGMTAAREKVMPNGENLAVGMTGAKEKVMPNGKNPAVGMTFVLIVIYMYKFHFIFRLQTAG